MRSWGGSSDGVALSWVTLAFLEHQTSDVQVVYKLTRMCTGPIRKQALLVQVSTVDQKKQGAVDSDQGVGR